MFLGHDRLNDVLSAHDVPNVCPLIGDRFRSCEAAPGRVLLAFELAKVSLFVAAVELSFDVGKGGLAHAPAKRIPHQGPLVYDGLALEVAGSCVGDGFLRPDRLFGCPVLRPGSLASLGHYRFRLVAERCGHGPVGL